MLPTLDMLLTLLSYQVSSRRLSNTNTRTSQRKSTTCHKPYPRHLQFGRHIQLHGALQFIVSRGFRQTQRFRSLAIHNAASDRLSFSLKNKDKLQNAHLQPCREPTDSLRAIPDLKFKTAVIVERLLIPIDTFCSYCADAGIPVPAEKYGQQALICRHNYGYTRRHNTVKDSLA